MVEQNMDEKNQNNEVVVRYISKAYITQIWDKVENYLTDALLCSVGEYDVYQLKTLLVYGHHHLLIVEEDNEIKGCCTVVFESYPNEMIAFVTTFGGYMVTNEVVWNQFESWCKNNGCTKVRAFTFEPMAKLLEKKFGFENVYLVVEKQL